MKSITEKASRTRVKTPPARPLMIFDGDCRFCFLWVLRWQRATGERIEYLPFQEPGVAARFPEVSREKFQKSVQLIEPDGVVYDGAEAVFRSLAVNPRRRIWLRMYYNFPGFAPLTEAGYRLVAKHRTFFSSLTRFFSANE